MQIIRPNWSAPPHVHAYTSTRLGGVSQAPFESLNLGCHVGDDAKHVQFNRSKIQDTLQIPSTPIWLQQTHSNTCIRVPETTNVHADASYTRHNNTVLAILTADCLPILVCNTTGTEIAAIHAGWRGLVSGIIESSLNCFQNTGIGMNAWIGPSICGQCFEIDDQVLHFFTNHYAFGQKMLKEKWQGKYAMDLPALAETILRENGVHLITQSKCCTFEQESTFYSYRRDANTGRMATFIWFS